MELRDESDNVMTAEEMQKRTDDILAQMDEKGISDKKLRKEVTKVKEESVPKTYPRNNNNRVSESKENVFVLPSARLLREAKSAQIKRKIGRRVGSMANCGVKICLIFMKNEQILWQRTLFFQNGGGKFADCTI